jgi:hypothetical protein
LFAEHWCHQNSGHTVETDVKNKRVTWKFTKCRGISMNSSALCKNPTSIDHHGTDFTNLHSYLAINRKKGFHTTLTYSFWSSNLDFAFVFSRLGKEPSITMADNLSTAGIMGGDKHGEDG